MRFSKMGCVGTLNLVLGDTVISGKDYDLSAFGGAIDQWTDIEVMAGDGQFSVVMNGEEIFSMALERYPGKIVGLRFDLRGGELGRVRLGR
ncbi:MAG: hypothetical protein R3B93_11270 [Bacteroidia bacterium]